MTFRNTTLTKDMIYDIMNKIPSPPPKKEILCGDMNEFVATMQRQYGKSVVLDEGRDVGVLSGIEVKLSHSVPMDKAVVLENRQIIAIIDLKEDCQ